MAPMPATVSRAEVANELREAVAAFSAAQRRLRSRDGRSGGLSIAQWHLLRQLAEADELPAGKLAAGADLTPASATQMLDHLAEQGWVERVRSDSDRRVVLNRLTPTGRERFEAKQAEIQERWRDALSDIPAEELAQAARVLRRMAEVLDQI
jgi:MarR family transcriptional regulator, organic hydroperoxide resistance regulator